MWINFRRKPVFPCPAALGHSTSFRWLESELWNQRAPDVKSGCHAREPITAPLSLQSHRRCLATFGLARGTDVRPLAGFALWHVATLARAWGERAAHVLANVATQ
jgi:hypothetical protein